MSERNKLRKTLREYYDTQEATYTEQDWRSASAMLDGERNKNKKRAAAYISIALLGLLFLGISVYKNFNNNIEGKLLSDSAAITEIKKHPAMPQTAQDSDSKPKSYIYPNKGTGTSAQPLESQTLRGRNSPATGSATIKTSEAATAASAPVSSGKNSIPEIKQNAMETPVPASEPVREEQSPALPSIPVTKLPESASEKNDAENSHDIPQAPAALAETINTTTIREEPKLTTQKTESAAEATATLAASDQTEAQEKNKQNTGTVAEQIHLPDSSARLADGETYVEPIIAQLIDEGIFYETGACWLYGWKNNEGRDARGFSPVAGINYMNRISHHMALSFGMQYTQVRNLKASSKTSRESVYKYGEQSKVTTIMPSALHYIVAPLRLNYFIDKRNCIGLGFNLAYLLTVDAKITTYEEKPGSAENFKSYKQGGYTQGMSWYDSQFALFYSRNIGRSLGIKAEVFYGLTDIKQNGFFGLDYTERNSGAKLTLIYYAFNKRQKQ